MNFRVNKEEIDDVDALTYLGSIVTRTGGAKEDVLVRIRNVNAAFVQHYPVWRAKGGKIKENKLQC